MGGEEDGVVGGIGVKGTYLPTYVLSVMRVRLCKNQS